MSGRIRFLGLVTILVLLGAVLLIGASGWAQKASVAKPPKPPVPPPPPADPAIAYVVNNYSGAAMKRTKGQLMVMNADGSNQQVVLTETGVEYGFPDWSPDGTQLVFTRNNIVGGDSGIYIININGTGFRKVVNFRFGDSYCYPVTWSPMPLADTNYKIAFTDSVRRPDGTYEIDHAAFIVNLDGTGLVQLTNPLESGAQIYWSPEADEVTFPAIDPETGRMGFGVYTINYVAETETFSITPRLICGEFPWGIWAYHQDKLALGHNNDIWICDISTNDPFLSNQVTFTPTAGEWIMSWSPDDLKILFVQLSGGGLYTINSDGSGGLVQISSEDFTWRSPRWRRNL